MKIFLRPIALCLPLLAVMVAIMALPGVTEAREKSLALEPTVGPWVVISGEAAGTLGLRCLPLPVPSAVGGDEAPLA